MIAISVSWLFCLLLAPHLDVDHKTIIAFRENTYFHLSKKLQDAVFEKWSSAILLQMEAF